MATSFARICQLGVSKSPYRSCMLEWNSSRRVSLHKTLGFPIDNRCNLFRCNRLTAAVLALARRLLYLRDTPYCLLPEAFALGAERRGGRLRLGDRW